MCHQPWCTCTEFEDVEAERDALQAQVQALTKACESYKTLLQRVGRAYHAEITEHARLKGLRLTGVTYEVIEDGR